MQDTEKGVLGSAEGEESDGCSNTDIDTNIATGDVVLELSGRLSVGSEN